MNQAKNNIPELVTEIADHVINELSFEDRVRIAKLKDDEIAIINTLMTDYIQSKLHEWSIQHEEPDLTKPETIIKEIWKRLRETHKLKIVE